MEEVQKLDKDVTYFVYCRTGVRSANSCLLMKELGFNNTYNLIGGIVDWKGEIIT
jgi:rhodanese-related sulfurtransferase